MAEQSFPPSPAFSGIDFNPAFFPSTASEYVEFPTAQGTVTFGEIFATDIDTPTPSVDFDFLSSEIGNINIGASVPTLKTIKLGQSTGASIHCGSIDLQGTNINNAVASDTGIISLAPKQTTGTLNIGTHPTTGTRTTGGINIATNSVGVTPIIIGTTGQTTTTLRGTTVDVVTKLTTPILDCVTDAGSGNTSLAIGGSATSGNIIIGAALGTGDVSIAAAQSAGGTVTIGSSNTVTTLSGSSVNVGTKLTAPKIDSTTLGTAMTVGENLTTGQLSIAQNQQTGLLNIGVCNSRSTATGNINIGTGASVSSAINIGGGDSSSGSINIGQIGTTTGTTTVNIGTSTVGSHPVNIGSTSALTTIKGASTLTGAVAASVGIKTPYIEPSLDTTDLEIAAAQTSGDLYIGSGPRTAASDINIGTGTNLAGNLFIGHKLTVVSTQAVKINTSTAASGATTIGSSSSATSIGGSLGVTGVLTASGGLTVPSGQLLTATGNGILSGRTSFAAGGATTISSTAINQYYTYIQNTAGAIVLPSAAVVNQYITLRNITSSTTTVSSSSNIWPTGTAFFATTYSLGAYASIILCSDGGTWYQLL